MGRAPAAAAGGAARDPNMPPGARRPAGVVLAGGASRRMGRDKALLEFGGETLVARAARALANVADPVVIADRGRGLVPGFPSVPDGAGAGPAAGILGAAAALPGRSLLALACDLPWIEPGLLALLVAEAGDGWIVPLSSRGLEPLCALYGPAALAALAERVARGEFDLSGLSTVPGLSVRELRVEEEGAFRNLNTPDDLRAALAQGAAASSRRKSKR